MNGYIESRVEDIIDALHFDHYMIEIEPNESNEMQQLVLKNLRDKGYGYNLYYDEKKDIWYYNYAYHEGQEISCIHCGITWVEGENVSGCLC